MSTWTGQAADDFPDRNQLAAFALHGSILPCSSDKTGTPPITRLDGSRAVDRTARLLEAWAAAEPGTPDQGLQRPPQPGFFPGGGRGAGLLVGRVNFPVA